MLRRLDERVLSTRYGPYILGPIAGRLYKRGRYAKHIWTPGTIGLLLLNPLGGLTILYVGRKDRMAQEAGEATTGHTEDS
jgi:hypothetical protein